MIQKQKNVTRGGEMRGQKSVTHYLNDLLGQFYKTFRCLCRRLTPLIWLSSAPKKAPKSFIRLTQLIMCKKSYLYCRTSCQWITLAFGTWWLQKKNNNLICYFFLTWASIKNKIWLSLFFRMEQHREIRVFQRP